MSNDTDVLVKSVLEPSLDGDGWAVRIGDSSWRFGRQDYAIMFRNRMSSDEVFAGEILDHSYNHNWDKCDIRVCTGRRWQAIQSLP